MVDGFGTILVPDYGITFRVLTFVGEALLIPWLLWKAIKASPSDAADSNRRRVAGSSADADGPVSSL